MKTLISIPQQGLSNRLLVLAYHRAFALLSGRKFLLDWMPDIHCNCHFSDLFENHFPFPETGVLETARLYDWTFIIDAKERGEDIRVDCPNNFFEKTEILAIKTCWPGYQERTSIFKNKIVWTAFHKLVSLLARYYLISLVPASKLRHEIETFPVDRTIGVHIRRADKERPDVDHRHYIPIFENQTLDEFMILINDELGNHPNHKIFLASNSPDVEEKIRQTYGSRVIIREKKSYDRDLMGLEDALVDLYLLSKTTKIIGTHGSTFSLVAARLGLKKLNTPRSSGNRYAVE